MIVIYVLGSLAAIATFLLTVPFFVVKNLPNCNRIELIKISAGPTSIPITTIRLETDSFKIRNLSNVPVNIEVKILIPEANSNLISPEKYKIKPWSITIIKMPVKDISRDTDCKFYDSYIMEPRIIACKLQVSCSTIFAIPYIKKYGVKFNLE